MPQPKPSHGPVLLHAKKGTVLLRRNRLPPIDCPLVELTNGGCRCQLNWNRIEPSAVGPWRMKLAWGTNVEVGLTAPPYVFSMTMAARVVFVEKFEGKREEITLNFMNMKPEQAELIERTVRVLDRQPAPKEDRKRVSESEPPEPPRRSGRLRQLAAKCRGRTFEDLVVAFGKITPARMANIQNLARRFKLESDRCIWRMGLLSSRDICRIWSLQSGLQVATAESLQSHATLPAGLDYDFMKAHRCWPLKETADAWLVAVARPPSAGNAAALEQKLGKTPQFCLIPIDELENRLLLASTDQQLSRRKHPRYRKHLPILIQLCDDVGVTMTQTLIFGKTVDLSEGGVAVSGIPAGTFSPEDLLRDNPWCRVGFFCPPHEINASCRIRHIQRGTNEPGMVDRWIYGLEFVELSDENRTRLKEICESLEREGKRC